MAYELWSVCTNLVGIIPSYLFFKKKFIVDGIYVLLTSIASMAYHIIYDVYSIKSEETYPLAIKNVDFIMADMLLLMLPSWIIWRNKYQTRFSIYITMIPVQTYVMWDVEIYRAYIYIIYLVPLSSYIIYKYWRDRWFLMGLCCSIFECLMYFWLAEKKDDHHHIYHGFHHVFAFSSIVCYQRIKDRP